MIGIKKTIVLLMALILVLSMSAVCLATTYYQDSDGDGYGNPSVSIENDTQPSGYVADNTDCDDTNPVVHPGAAEICDGLDNDCNTATLDGSGETAPLNSLQSGVCANSSKTCSGAGGWVNDYSGIDDYEANETSCDSLDNDCDGQVDEVMIRYYRDSDGDSYGNSSSSQQACSQTSGYVTRNTDCNDKNASISPDAIERCDGIDNNCDGHIDDGLNAPLNLLQKGVCAGSLKTCDGADGWVNDYSGIDDYKANETSCDGIDNNCDGQVDEGLSMLYYQDSDRDGFGSLSSSKRACSQPSGYVASNTDCNDKNASISPDATEICDGLDNNCDGQIDEGLLKTYYMDSDNDTYGSNATLRVCSQPSGYVLNNRDCNDTRAGIHPGAEEICGNGMDENCNSADSSCPLLGAVVGVLKKPAVMIVSSLLILAAVVAIIAFFVGRGKKKVSVYP